MNREMSIIGGNTVVHDERYAKASFTRTRFPIDTVS